MAHFTTLPKYILTEFTRKTNFTSDAPEHIMPTEPGVYITANANERFRLLESGEWEEWEESNVAYNCPEWKWIPTYPPTYDTVYGPVPST